MKRGHFLLPPQQSVVAVCLLLKPLWCNCDMYLCKIRDFNRNTVATKIRTQQKCLYVYKTKALIGPLLDTSLARCQCYTSYLPTMLHVLWFVHLDSQLDFDVLIAFFLGWSHLVPFWRLGTVGLGSQYNLSEGKQVNKTKTTTNWKCDPGKKFTFPAIGLHRTPFKVPYLSRLVLLPHKIPTLQFSTSITSNTTFQ